MITTLVFFGTGAGVAGGGGVFCHCFCLFIYFKLESNIKNIIGFFFVYLSILLKIYSSIVNVGQHTLANVNTNEQVEINTI